MKSWSMQGRDAALVSTARIARRFQTPSWSWHRESPRWSPVQTVLPSTASTPRGRPTGRRVLLRSMARTCARRAERAGRGSMRSKV
ncbi:MAG: hypothetical protein U0326_13990 [Polyangiales bacterium]